jgi:peptidoglycan/LPS O-acetylase OafA/YrhL
VIGVKAVSSSLTALLRVARPIRWLAGATFSLYLFHLPVAQFLASLAPWAPSSWATRVVIVGGTLVIVFALAAVTERRKKLWRAGFNLIERQGTAIIRQKA